MTTLTITLPRLHAGQAEIFEAPYRFKVLVCGRRWGKSSLAKEVLIDRMLAGHSTAYFAPTYKNLKEVWRDLNALVSPLMTYSNQAEMRLELVTGGTVDFWSLGTLSAETVRGRAYETVILDEAALIQDGLEKWNRIIFPLLTDYGGAAYFLTTPRGKMNWIYDLYRRGIDGVEGWASWQKPTIDNPYIPAEEVALAQTQMLPEDFGQEYLAEFTTLSGAVFPNWHDSENVTPAADYDPAYPVEWTVDPGYTNPMAIVLSQERPFDGRPDHLCFFDEVYVTQHLERDALLKAFRLGYPPPSLFLYDPESPQVAVEMQQFRSYGVPALGIPPFMCQIVAADKRPGSVAESIKVLRRYIGPDGNGRRLLRVHPRCKNLIEELPTYVYADTARTRGGDPVPDTGQKDHAVDCARYRMTPFMFKADNP